MEVAIWTRKGKINAGPISFPDSKIKTVSNKAKPKPNIAARKRRFVIWSVFDIPIAKYNKANLINSSIITSKSNTPGLVPLAFELKNNKDANSELAAAMVPATRNVKKREVFFKIKTGFSINLFEFLIYFDILSACLCFGQSLPWVPFS